jgi:hypothetical protein
LLRREGFNASNFTKAAGALTAIFGLVVVAMGTFTGRDAIIITTFSIFSLLTLSVERIILRRRRKAAPPQDDI